MRPAALALALPLLAATAAAAADPSGDAATISRLRAHTAFLADDRMRGRDTGSPEYAIAALYAATRFQALGLEPGGAGGTFEQPVRFVEARVASPSLAVARSGKSVALEMPADFVMLGGLTAKTLAVDAPVVFAGRGIRAPEQHLDDYAGLDVRGKVVLIFGGGPPSFPNDLRAHYSSRRLKAQTAEAQGAVGILTISDAIDEKRVPWARLASHADRPRTAWLHPDGAIADAFPGLEFAATLSRAGATKLLEGTGTSFDALQAAAADGSYQRRELPVRVRAGGRVEIANVESPNVVAVLRGSDPALAGESVVVSAHLDHIGVQPQPENGDAINNGFFDNAMGSAIAIEVARALSTAEHRPRRSVVFLLVCGEERGLLGSDEFAHHPTVPGIVADVNVDMPLLFGPLGSLVAFGAEHSSLGAVTAAAASARGIALVPDPRPEEVVFVRSDQYSFVRQGVPSIFLNPGPGDADAQAKVTEFLKGHYHRPSDQTDLPIDWQAAADFTGVEVDIVRSIADADARPTWNAGDFFAPKAAPAGR
jgi:Zn-dependent M28 family amino/carboxypeptidase